MKQRFVLLSMLFSFAGISLIASNNPVPQPQQQNGPEIQEPNANQEEEEEEVEEVPVVAQPARTNNESHFWRNLGGIAAIVATTVVVTKLLTKPTPPPQPVVPDQASNDNVSKFLNFFTVVVEKAAPIIQNLLERPASRPTPTAHPPFWGYGPFMPGTSGFFMPGPNQNNLHFGRPQQ